MPLNQPLPVDELLEPLVRTLASHRAVVIEAPPGAGKTTRVPRALLESSLTPGREIWVTEPRRLAARLAAGFVARELGVELGGRVGYSVRFEEKSSADTRLWFVTEGVLLRRLLGREGGRSLGVVVLDEFHERHVATDLLLVLLAKRLQVDPELRLVVMSATLDADAVARYLGDCPRLRCEGRLYPLSVRHEAREDDRPLFQRVSSAVKQLVREQPSGDLLVFLPGAGEIRDATNQLEAFTREQGIELHALHGELPLDAQAKAIAPSTRRKLVLSTNVAESSVTVEGVTIVIDSGLARIAEHSPWTGRQSLEVRPIAQASAIQRAGRAGRTQPGQVFRLFTEHSFRSRPAQERPEIQRLDLAEPLLALYGAGLTPRAEDWLDAPSATMLESAQKLLERLGFVAGDRVTPLGRRALGLPLAPRLARVVLEGERLGVGDRACLAAALLADRDIRQNPGGPGGPRGGDMLGCEGDLDLLIELFRMAKDDRFHEGALRRLGLHSGRVATVRQSYQQIRRDLGLRRDDEGSADEERQNFGLALIAGFPDRVARRRQPGGRDLILATGHVAQQADESVAKNASLLLALDAEDRSHAPASLQRGEKRAPRHGIRVRIAEPIEAEWLLDQSSGELSEKEELAWDEARERVQLTSSLAWGAVVLDQSERPAPPSDAASALLERAAVAKQASLFTKQDDLDELLGRCALLAEAAPGSSFERVAGSGTRELIALACRDKTSLAELRDVDFRELVLGELGASDRARLEREAPEHVTLDAGRRVRVHYTKGQPPWIESRLQDFFGMKEGPRIAGGRVPLTLHLLAPNQRAVQVTSDLAGFWVRHYPSVRKELSRRYPRHAWPDDGRRLPEKKTTNR
ncbi:MAG TPA: ATP-dependent helicase HrpB [Polyangiaceae bacterium]|nr:ATP-dependent helicase HrpB [Polyangiaceae bacterium]